MVDFSTSNGYAWQVVQYNLKYDITKGSLIDSRIQDGLGDDETSLDGITKAVNKDITEGVDGKSDSSITVGKRNADEIEWLKL
ncbi:hypothetical protein EV178_001067 [Coemansia sp. RSA 1646]|nr:hypothetical protein EV178_001067 [Coemansia sp. RSA 1646]